MEKLVNGDCHIKRKMLQNKENLVVVAAIKDKTGRFLVQKRIDDTFLEADGKWEFPGVGVEAGERMEDALRRECLEEIGCDIEIIEKIPLVLHNSWIDKYGNKTKTEVHSYLCSIEDCKPVSSNNEVGEVHFFSREEIKTLQLLSSVDKILSAIK